MERRICDVGETWVSMAGYLQAQSNRLFVLGRAPQTVGGRVASEKKAASLYVEGSRTDALFAEKSTQRIWQTLGKVEG